MLADAGADHKHDHDRGETALVEPAEGQRPEPIAHKHQPEQRRELPEIHRRVPLEAQQDRPAQHVQRQEQRRQGGAELRRAQLLRLQPEHERRTADADRGGEHAAREPGHCGWKPARHAPVAQLPEGCRDHGHAHADLERLAGQGGQQHGAQREARHRGEQQPRQQRPAHIVPLEQHEHVEHRAQQEQCRHGLGGLHHREQRRREHQREAEARGRLHRGPQQCRQGGQEHQPTVTSSFGNPVRISGSPSVTITRSSMRTPTCPARRHRARSSRRWRPPAHPPPSCRAGAPRAPGSPPRARARGRSAPRGRPRR